MQACVEVWESDPGRVPLQRRSATSRSAPRCRSPTSPRRLRASGADRLPLRADHRRGRGRRAHEGALPRLAREGRHGLSARAPGRLRVQRRVRARACATSASPRACRSLEGVEVTGFVSRDDGSVIGARDERGRDRGRRAGRDRARARGRQRFWALLGCPTDRHHDAVRRRRPRPADVDVLEPAGGRDHGRPADVRDGRRRCAAGDPPRHRRTAVHRRRRARDRRALGDLLQARPPRRPGRRLTADRRRRRRARPVPVDDGRRSDASRTCGARRSRTR